jgi:hypothetical protein
MAVAGFGQGLVISPLFGFVLSGVPAARAGVGSGILTTTQQASLALGVASLGSLFLSLSSAQSLGVHEAFVVVLAAQTAVAVLVALGSRALAQPVRVPPSEVPEVALELSEAALGVEQAA